MAKYIFITGGVVSSLGKGVAAAGCGTLLQSRGYTVHARKFDPYLNIDPGAMSPLQHGEVYVTNDGHETDLDLGYYERFLNVQLSRNDSVSGGRIYWEVLNAERRGEYGGATVQLIPHVTNKIKEHILKPTDTDFVIYEIGGTVGDIEGQIFLESIRQFANDVGRKNVLFVHLTLAPYLEKSGELKTKPTQMSVRNLLEHGIQTDMLIVRSPRMLDADERRKIGMFCNLPANNVISGLDVDNIYQIPLAYEAQDVFTIMAKHFGLPNKPGDLSRLEKIEKYLKSDLPQITVAVIGKYFDTPDSYKSLNEALFHAGIQNDVRVQVKKIDAKNVSVEQLVGVDGILVPSGFGPDNVSGEVIAAKYARENNIPYFGIGLGMQTAVIEFMQNVVGIKDAGSAEFESKGTLIVKPGESMRLGADEINLVPNSKAYDIYKSEKISERHRNKYELDLGIKDALEKNGMIISGMSLDKKHAEVIEIKNHPFFIAGIFHPEYQSNPYSGHPLFNAFVSASLAKNKIGI